MIVAIHQPHYLPWPGYFDKMVRADVFILGDTVQMQDDGHQHRNRIRTPQGTAWLTVPLVHVEGQRLQEARIRYDQADWRRKHLAALQMSYGRAPHWKVYRDELAAFYAQSHAMFVDLAAACIDLFRRWLGIATPLVWASDLLVTAEDPTQRIIELCRAVGADTYLSGAGGRDYMDYAALADAGLQVVEQQFAYPTYRQVFPGFEPNLAMLDLLMMEGYGARQVLGWE